MKHTPGPWRAICTLPVRGDPFGTSLVATGGGPQAICCHKSGKTLAEDRANAHLIAAAPDLLEACREVAGTLDKRAHTLTTQLAIELARDLLAAIAKAGCGA